jgi:hypothetical protein
MALVTDEDVQSHLPKDKLKVEDIPDDRNQIYLDAERIVRGYLAGVIDSSVLAAWTTPTATPGIIRTITGKLCAAEIYRVRFSEQSLDDPKFAQNQYNEAMALLKGIVAGDIRVEGVEDTTQFDNTYFEPNDASTDPPKFLMSGRF